MFNDRISDYFEGVAAKYLSAVDAERDRSNQHEIGGLPSAGFKEYLGTPGKQDEYRFRARQIYIGDEVAESVTCDSQVTWYDSRRNVEHRSPEYRLYYYDSPVTECLGQGDFCLIAKLKDGVLPAVSDLPGFVHGNLLMVFTPAGSVIEHQLRAMFGLDVVETKFARGKLNAVNLLLPLRLMLEDLGIEVGGLEGVEASWLDPLLRRFGGESFPSTKEFSSFARYSAPTKVSPVDEPDVTLMCWMEHEESLFRVYERHLVQRRLRDGFGVDGQDVDAFVAFSLSVQNRRKSRVGYAFEAHLSHLFEKNGVEFEQSRGKGRVTENKSKPDFLFPSFAAYQDAGFSSSKLFMLGAKTTCKDRWRQVLSEADRISVKHLVTLEPAISEAQTEEMQYKQLQLVVPHAVQATYTEAQRRYLIDLKGFICTVIGAQAV